MKKTIQLVCLLGAFLWLERGRCAPFQDLNFDSANTNTIFDSSGFGDYAGPIGDLMPGWSLTSVLGPELSVGFNRAIPGLGWTTIVSPSFGGGYPVVGSYSFAMFPKSDLQSYIAYSLSQSGDLPADVRSIHFLSYGAPLELRVNGSILALNYTPIPNLNVPVFDAAGDISSFAGLTVELRFTTLPGPSVLNGLDEISFSTIPIPEPDMFLLLSLGGFVLVSRQRRQ